MARFRFKLEALLRHRERLEEERQRALAMLLRQKLILETQLRNQQQAISQDKREMAGALTGHVDVRRIRQHAVHAGRGAVSAQRIAFRLLELAGQIDKARALLNEAVRQRKAIEVLRNRHHEQWSIEQKRIEANQLDEAAAHARIRLAQEVAR